MRRIFFLITCLVLSVAAVADSGEANGEKELRVLFIGNSLTYQNQLPSLVAALGRADGWKMEVESVAAPDRSLEDHWRQGRARAVLAGSSWDVVVLQQGPSSLPENQAHLKTWSIRWSDLIREHGARPALYMVWPSRKRLGDFARVVNSYTGAARAADAELYPAGIAWLLAIHNEPEFELYGTDGFHPSLTGTALSAMVIHAGMTGSQLRNSSPELELSEPDQRTLQEIAQQAISETQ